MAERREDKTHGLFRLSRRVQVVPVLVGTAVAIGGGWLAFWLFVLMPVDAFRMATDELFWGSPLYDERRTELGKFLFSPMNVLYLNLVGVFLVAFGGLVVALMAKHSRVQHALGMGLLCLAFSILVHLDQYVEEIAGVQNPLWPHVLFALAVLPAAYVGGWLGSKFRPRLDT